MLRKVFLGLVFLMLAAVPAKAQRFEWIYPSTSGAVNPTALHCHVFPPIGGLYLNIGVDQVFTLTNTSMPTLPGGAPNKTTMKVGPSCDIEGGYDDCIIGNVNWPVIRSNSYGDTISITLKVTSANGTVTTSAPIQVIKKR